MVVVVWAAVAGSSSVGRAARRRSRCRPSVWDPNRCACATSATMLSTRCTRLLRSCAVTIRYPLPSPTSYHTWLFAGWGFSWPSSKAQILGGVLGVANRIWANRPDYGCDLPELCPHEHKPTPPDPTAGASPPWGLFLSRVGGANHSQFVFPYRTPTPLSQQDEHEQARWRLAALAARYLLALGTPEASAQRP